MTAKARHAGFEVAVVGLGKASGFRGESCLRKRRPGERATFETDARRGRLFEADQFE